MKRNFVTLNLIIKALNKAFGITLGDASIFVSLQIERDRANNIMRVHQKAYTRKIINKFAMVEAKSVSVPADKNIVLYPTDENDKKIIVPYREAVGSLMFLALVSRPDIAYAVNVVSRFMNNYNQVHWNAVKRIIRYLKGTINFAIEFKASANRNKLFGYSDADFAMDVCTRRSTSGYIFILAGGPISWLSQRQRAVALSTTKAEYVAASLATREAIWLRTLLNNLGHVSNTNTLNGQ